MEGQNIQIENKQGMNVMRNRGRILALFRKRMFAVIVGMIIVFGAAMTGFQMDVYAEETAAFHVQTAEMQSDGTIRVSVYLTDTSNLGGIDAELVYDSSKVTYVSSGLGGSFTGDYGLTNHVAEESLIKCVTIYSDAKAAHGELMYAVFRLNGTQSYQPEFRVVDMVDASADLQPIPYTITYQQADGTWTDTRDTSEKAADASVIAQAREDYGAPEDQGTSLPGTPGNPGADSDDADSDDGTQDEETQETESQDTDTQYDAEEAAENSDISEEEKKEQSSGSMIRIIIPVLVIVVIVIGLLIWRMKGKKKDEE